MFSQALFALIPVVAIILTPANAQSGYVTLGGNVVTHTSTYCNLEYSWTYVDDADPYVDFIFSITSMRNAAKGDQLVGVSLGLVPQQIVSTGSSGSDLLYMKSARNVHIAIVSTSSGVEAEIQSLTKESCSSNEECAALSWSSASDYSDIFTNGYGDCSFADRLTVTSLRHQQKLRWINIDLGLRIYKDAFQNCATGNDNADLYEFSMEPETPVTITWAIWSNAKRDSRNCFSGAHDNNYDRSDNATITLVAAAPTPEPTPAPTQAPTTPIPTKAPTPEPTNRPTTPIPTAAPTTPEPTKNPTPSPTNRPTKTLQCPDRKQWVECSRVNEMYRYLSKKTAKRKALIEKMCKSSKFKSKCTWCDSQGDNFMGCRPKKMEDGTKYDTSQLCPTEDWPWADLGCKQFETCPDSMLMDACKQVNELPVSGTNRNRRPICINAFQYGDYSVGKGDCHWCRGRCRAIAPYKYKIAKEIICENDNFFNSIYNCSYGDGPGPSGITSKYYDGSGGN